MSIYIDNKKLLSLPDLAGGGVNLFRNTYDFATWQYTPGKGDFEPASNYNSDSNHEFIQTKKVAHLWGNNSTEAKLLYTQPLHLEKGTYTVSFLARDNGPDPKNSSFGLELYSSYTNTHGGNPHGMTKSKLSNVWSSYSITFALPEQLTLADISLGHWGPQELIPGGSIYLTNLKLEKGPVATPWSPNPLDILDEIEALKRTCSTSVEPKPIGY
ncbi:hypothetical protein [Lactobacillus crispatus]|uniref:hypothetical protein n=1 Tax=Lactobacillus crispatus TaxID=47770 RepID=UPI001F09C8AD|nr:hypothetical protein [Lactobacillus crispatus]MCT7732459.1 hypothetical protein [Lactobacillus crispatus]MCT7741458.1 hypothetical protein [Lactobacillus crispatus]MCT7788175.1 hypothetical protein [Lactobacillus crispatus]MCT7820266.1 hypothetical protein [Lactobacillus crispatus]MCT7852596.1 hypothetical protein [Lactobacillus crispatus]